MFTIIITTHDRPLLLRRALQSLIQQTYQDFQVVIVADSALYLPPYEELLLLTGKYQFLIRSGVDGPAESRNIGVKLTTTEYLMFLDDDDTFAPNHLQDIAQFVSEHKADIIYTNFQIYREDRSVTPPHLTAIEAFSLQDITKESIYVRNTIPNNCLVYRTSILKNIEHDHSMRIYEDWDFLLQCLNQYDLTHLPIMSPIIHKTINTDADNLRRGNSRNDLVCEVTLSLYKKFPAPDPETKLARQRLFENAGIHLDISEF